MGLPDGQWAAVIFNDYALAFLRAEQDTGVAELIAANPSFGPTISQALADTADTANGDQNWLRLRVLNLIRCRYVGEIPPDTAWHQVASLTDSDLANLYVTRHPTWISTSDNNELRAVAGRKPGTLRQPPASWAPIILWGRERGGHSRSSKATTGLSLMCRAEPPVWKSLFWSDFPQRLATSIRLIPPRSCCSICGELAGAPAPAIVSKSGGFGGDDLLVRLFAPGAKESAQGNPYAGSGN